MMFRVALFAPLFVLAGLLAAAPAEAQRRGESRDVFEAMRTGKLLSIRDIEHRVVPTMRDAQYLGFDFDSGSGIYTLKFLRNGNVIWVEVDGHSGQVVGRSGN
ncbi:hypothetical protein [Sphingomonas sp.]|uniref:hypothetical protein n=1 Tax=Sphingomonas sp. TaxID=28214 RepID=UPI0025CF9163|nr:hypothetical protein [Sphingomonas sp.]